MKGGPREAQHEGKEPPLTATLPSEQRATSRLHPRKPVPGSCARAPPCVAREGPQQGGTSKSSSRRMRSRTPLLSMRPLRDATASSFPLRRSLPSVVRRLKRGITCGKEASPAGRSRGTLGARQDRGHAKMSEWSNPPSRWRRSSSLARQPERDSFPASLVSDGGLACIYRGLGPAQRTRSKALKGVWPAGRRGIGKCRRS